MLKLTVVAEARPFMVPPVSKTCLTSIRVVSFAGTETSLAIEMSSRNKSYVAAVAAVLTIKTELTSAVVPGGAV